MDLRVLNKADYGFYSESDYNTDYKNEITRNNRFLQIDKDNFNKLKDFLKIGKTVHTADENYTIIEILELKHCFEILLRKD